VAALLVDGLKLFVITLVYGILVGAVYVVLVGGGSLAGDTVAALLGVVATVIAILIGYVVPAAVTNFAVEESVGAAFDVGTIRSVVTSREYAVGILFAIAISIVGGAVAGILSFVLVGVFVLFYANVAAYYCVARGFAEARGTPSAELTAEAA